MLYPRFALAALFVVLPVSLANAQLATSPMHADQYHVVEIEGGVLRIDRQTGDISECESTTNGWVCRLAADDRLAYEAEINRLDAELARVEQELAAARRALEDGGQDYSFAPDSNSDDVRERLNLPTDEELDAVMDTAEEVMRRFFSVVEGIRRENEAERGL